MVNETYNMIMKIHVQHFGSPSNVIIQRLYELFDDNVLA